MLFAFRLEGAAARSFELPGLRPGAWRISGADGAAEAGGVRVTLAERFRSALLVVEVDA